MERLLLLADSAVNEDTVRLALPRPVEAHSQIGGLAERVEAFERNTILEELKRTRRNMTETARALGLERSHLYKKCTQLGIELQSM